jgi:hypothetical protein
MGDTQAVMSVMYSLIIAYLHELQIPPPISTVLPATYLLGNHQLRKHSLTITTFNNFPKPPHSNNSTGNNLCFVKNNEIEIEQNADERK